MYIYGWLTRPHSSSLFTTATIAAHSQPSVAPQRRQADVGGEGEVAEWGNVTLLGRRRADRPTFERVSVIIPTLNEAKNLPWVLERIPPYVDEIVIIDGHSTDDTVAVAQALRPDVVVVEEHRRGKGVALRTGFAAATGDIVVMLDADGSMDPAEFTRYIALLGTGYDFVKGSRFMAGGASTDITGLRRLGNAGLKTMVNLLFGARFSDLCYGYCAFRRKHLDALALTADGFEIETQLILHALSAGLRISEVPTLESPRLHGHSNLRTFRDGMRVLRTLLREWITIRLRRPPRPDLPVDHDLDRELTDLTTPTTMAPNPGIA